MKSQDIWYLYVIMCENRTLFSGITKNIKIRLKDQFSQGSKTSKFLMSNKPLILIKKKEFRIKANALREKHRINSLSTKEANDYILGCFLKVKPQFEVKQIARNNFEIKCIECGSQKKINCKSENLKMEVFFKKCICNEIRQKINDLFEQAILGIGCIYNGRFMFKGRKDDSARDFILGLSNSSERNRAMAAYDLLSEISFKNTYLLLSAIMEELYYLIKSNLSSLKNIQLPEKYQHFSFKKDKNNFLKNTKKIRFISIALFIRNFANVLKHTGGILDATNSDSGKTIFEYFKLQDGLNLVELRDAIKISGITISNVFLMTSRLYIFIMDLVSYLFNFNKFRITNTKHHLIEKNLVNYDVRDEFTDFLKTIKDGSVFFMDL